MANNRPAAFAPFYPEIRLTTTSHAQKDSRLSFGHVSAPGTYASTITRPDLFANYLEQQIALLMQNHGVPVQIGYSTTPIPVHFAVSRNPDITVPQEGAMTYPLRDVFDVPDLSTTNDDIVNGVAELDDSGAAPLAPFTAQRVDYSLARLSHYTATMPEDFQNHVLFTNYQFYVEEFEAYARQMLADPDSGYEAFVGPGYHRITTADGELPTPPKLAADAQLSPDAPRWVGDHACEYRCRPLERENRNGPHCGATPACMADGRPLRGPSQQPAAWRFRSGPRLSA